MILIIIKDEIGIAYIGNGNEHINSFVEKEIAPICLGSDLNLSRCRGTRSPNPEDT